MTLLLATSLLWSLSFGLIKTRLTGLDPGFVAAARLALSALVFLPFLRRGGGGRRRSLELAAVGAVQFGLMYVLVIRSYGHLAAWQVALFTVLTPLHVVLLEGARRRSLPGRHLAAALLAVAGAAWISWPERGASPAWTGFLLVQGSNLCFALGQLLYRARVREDGDHAGAMARAYLGAVAVAATVCLFETDLAALRVDGEQAATLVYLGVVASGLGFFLWNRGATQVGVGTLAVMNNVKVPLAVLVSLTLFGEQADPARLVPGAGLVALALWLVRRR